MSLKCHMHELYLPIQHSSLETLLPAGKTQLMEHDTAWHKVVFRSSRNPVG